MKDIEQLQEQISAFMDGEDHMEPKVNRKLSACWERYHLIGDAIRNNAPELMAHNVAAGVRTDLKKEPAIVAPANIQNPLANRKRLAIAAGIVGAIAVGSVMWLNQTSAPGINSAVPLAGLERTPKTHLVVKNGRQIERLSDPRLNTYISRHDAAALKRKLTKAPHIRVVAYPE